MKEFSNPIIKEEANRHKKNIFIGLFLLGLCLICIIWGIFASKEAKENMPSLHDVIVNQNDKENVLSYVDSDIYPYLFAGLDGNDAKYYLIRDKDYMYVAYMYDYDYERLKDESLYLDGKTEKLIGVSSLVPTEIKKRVIDTVNELWPDEEITLADYEYYFGNVYLDMTSDAIDTAFWQTFLAFIFGMIGTTFVLSGLISSKRFQKNIKKLSLEDKKKIDSETLDKDAFYYANIHLYLTPSYIILMNNTFKVIPYSSLLWLYTYEQRVNGIKSTKSIIAISDDGKTNTIATIPALTKKYMEIFDEVFTTISNKNEEMLIGYTNENCQIMHDTLKKLKECKKENKN